MSWSISKTFEKDEYPDLAGLISDEEYDKSGNTQAPGERNRQINSALQALEAILDYGAFDNAKELVVSMSGHANEGHQKSEGYANDFISINLSIKSYKE